MHLYHALLYLSSLPLHDWCMKLPTFTPPLYGVGEHNAKILFSFFLNLDTVVSDTTFGKLNEIEQGQ